MSGTPDTALICVKKDSSAMFAEVSSDGAVAAPKVARIKHLLQGMNPR